MNAKGIKAITLFGLICLLLTACVPGSDQNPAELSMPGVTLTLSPEGKPQEVTTGVQLLVLLTVLSMAPSVLVLATSFTRIVIVLSMLRSAIGAPNIPPNQVIVGLALLLTFFIMAPIYKQVDEQAIQPYAAQEIDQKTAFERAIKPLRDFMFKQTREKDLALFVEISQRGSSVPNVQRPATLEDIDTLVLLPAFVLSELRASFVMGFVIYIPFLVIDMVVSSVLLSMGMMMLPPALVSLPFKLLLFVMVDGWYLITRSLVLSFGG